MNQIEAAVAKAALGRSWPHGLAEECGQAAAWLAARGFDGVGTALEAINPGPAEPTVVETPEAFIFQAAQAARAAPSAFDLLASNSDLKRVLLRATDQPVLVIGFAGIMVEPYGNAYQLTFGNNCQANVDRSVVTIVGSLPVRRADVSIERRAAMQHARTFVPIDIEIDDDLWHDALTLAAHSYVPSSLSSRRFGAGAGLNDTD